MMHTTDRSRPARLHRRFEATRGQILVIFALSIFVFISLSAVVVDVSWFWSNELRMQRAADAAALAGVVHLPGDVQNAVIDAKQEAAKNGYPDGVNTNIVTAWQDPTNPRRLRVTVEARVGTFFARVIGINSFPAAAQAKADYVLPVPMGSPENYYGVFGKIRHNHSFADQLTPWFSASNTKGTNTWTTPTNVYVSDANRSTSITNNQAQQWGDFNITFPPTATSITIKGIELSAQLSRSGTGNQTNCQIKFELSFNSTPTWTTGVGTGVKTSTALPSPEAYQSLGSAADTWNRSWTATQLNNTNFRVRATTVKPSTAVCANAILHRINHLQVRVTYDYSDSVVDVDVASPYGAALTARGFWGVMLSEGADNVNGDAYLPFYDDYPSDTNVNYNAKDYYNYAIEMPAGGGGEVWVFDPGFCAVDFDQGTGDRYFGNANTAGKNGISAFYRLYDTKNTLYDESDDGAPVATSGNVFKQQAAADPTMIKGAYSMTNLTDCSWAAGLTAPNPQYYHNRWYPLATGLPGGTTSRLKTSTTDPALPDDQKNMNGQNSFAIWTKAAGGTPKVHGLGAMEAYSPLDQNASSDFYLAQIAAEHAGKSVSIKLWDPGDTNGLTSNIEIRMPTPTGYQSQPLNYTALRGTTNVNATNCDATDETGQPNLITHTGGGSSGQKFNGCWVTIIIPIPPTYTAPQPPLEAEPGWWKIRYNVGPGAAAGYDLTTWQVEIRGNPVHLVLP